MLKQLNTRSGIGTLLILVLPLLIACAPRDSNSANKQDPGQPNAVATPDTPPANAEQANNPPTANNTPPVEPPQPDKHTIDLPSNWARIGKQEEIWIDAKAKEVIIAGTVCLNEGALEMFMCPQQTKEHESVISANALASQVHASLIALGADPGKSTSWDPEYRAAYGPTIEITLIWHDAKKDKQVSMSANKWIRNVKTKKPLAHQWVFGGSEFWQDPDTGEQVYYGDSGELVCLSNFSTATIDVNVESSESNAGLLFEAFTENIPPVGTKVYAVLKPGKRIEPVEKPKSPSGTVTKPGGQE
jgi:hypothetical protein